MREPKKFVRRMKDRVHAISGAKGRWHYCCKIIYVKMINLVPSDNMCSAFTVQYSIRHFKSISKIGLFLSCLATKENTQKEMKKRGSTLELLPTLD